MKNILVQGFYSSVTGILFALGLVIGAEFWGDYFEESEESGFEYVNFPEGINIVNPQKLEGAPRFTITGSIENKSQTDWSLIRLEAKLFVGSFQVNVCGSGKGRVSNLNAGEQRRFEIECLDTAGVGEPESFTYIVEAVSGRRKTSK